MRKHSARKWLHFVLDLLPILVLPIFAIYEINHEHNTPIEVEVDVNEIIDFNQRIDKSTYTSNSNWYTVNCTKETTSQNIKAISSNGYIPYGVYYTFPYYCNNTHKYLVKFDIEKHSLSNVLYGSLCGGFNQQFLTNMSDGFYTVSAIYNNVGTAHTSVTFYLGGTDPVIDDYFILSNIQFFDLTQMFGSGNEPTIEQFNTYFTNQYYDYTLSHKQLFSVGTETLTNTDLGSQMMYALYKPVKDYFNFNNVFNFGDIYHWFELNMFGGNAPMPIFIVWNIIVYQFLMDLMFLVYSIFMFIIDFTSECLERCFSFSRHGGSR